MGVRANCQGAAFTEHPAWVRKAPVLARMQTDCFHVLYLLPQAKRSLSRERESLLQCNTFYIQPIFTREEIRRERDPGWQDGAKESCCCMEEVTLLPWRVIGCSYMGQMWSVWEEELAGSHFKVCSRGLAGGNNGLQLWKSVQGKLPEDQGWREAASWVGKKDPWVRSCCWKNPMGESFKCPRKCPWEKKAASHTTSTKMALLLPDSFS